MTNTISSFNKNTPFINPRNRFPYQESRTNYNQANNNYVKASISEVDKLISNLDKDTKAENSKFRKKYIYLELKVLI